MKCYRIIIILLLLFGKNITAQLDLKLSTNSNSYEYGNIINLSCAISNYSDSTVNILLYNSGTCQAEFQFDDYQSWLWTTCLPVSEEVFISSQNSRVYSWTLDPKRLGIPNNNNLHKIIAFFRYSPPPYSTQNTIELSDTIYIEAPKYLGGQLNVGFVEENDSLVSVLKDSLNVEVLNRSISNKIHETWQITNNEIDSVKYKLENNSLLSSVEYNRMIEVNSISTLTSVYKDYEVEDKYYLFNNYPNPFNPTTKISYKIADNEFVSLKVYNSLGQEVQTLVNKQQSGGHYNVEFTGSELSSGIYFYVLKTRYLYKITL